MAIGFAGLFPLCSCWSHRGRSACVLAMCVSALGLLLLYIRSYSDCSPTICVPSLRALCSMCVPPLKALCALSVPALS
jgi:hypothetical protein